ncbi:MAG: TIGR02996 domain-containing protein, partial [Gemmata sp.]
MTPDEQSFLSAVIATPGADTVRLVYADWLEESGDPPRAAFIAAQVELARTPPGTAEDERR